jgi:vitamin B12 transporter
MTLFERLRRMQRPPSLPPRLRAPLLAVAAAVLLAATATAPAAAQLPADTFRLRELVVTAHRIPLPPDAITAAVSVITRAELQERGIHHLPDALRTLPGVVVAETGGFGGLTSLFLRGGESNFVRVLVDGVPVNEPGGAVDLSAWNTGNVERIELVRGPTSVLYGSDAVAGVLQIITRRGTAAPSLQAAARAGSFGSVALSADAAGPLPRGDYAFGISRFATDGIYEFNSQHRNTTASGSLGLGAADGTSVRATLRMVDARYHYPTDGTGAVVDRNAHQTTERLALALEAGTWLRPRVETRALLTLSRDRLGIDDRPDGPADTLGFFGYLSDGRLLRRGADLRANLYLAPGAILTLGAAAERQEETTTTLSMSEWGDFDGEFDATRANRGVYGQAHAEPRAGLVLSGGARVDDNDAFGRFLTWRAGAALRVSPATRLRVQAGTAFKEPSFFENYSTGFAIGNPDLDPERSRSVEAGLEQTLVADGRLRVSATAFHQRFHDLIQFIGRPFGSPEPNFVNVAAATAAGAELALHLHAGRLGLEAAYTHLRTEVTAGGQPGGSAAEFVTGDALIRRPAHTGSLDARYVLGSAATLNGRLFQVGRRADLAFTGSGAERIILDRYTRIDVGAERRLAAGLLRGRSPELALRMQVENLLAARYEDVAGFVARGRTVWIGGRAGLGHQERR